MKTVNIIEYVNGSIKNLTAFKDNPKGNKEAETLFTKIAKENDFIDEDITVALDNGVAEKEDYQLFIVHSN